MGLPGLLLWFPKALLKHEVGRFPRLSLKGNFPIRLVPLSIDQPRFLFSDPIGLKFDPIDYLLVFNRPNQSTIPNFLDFLIRFLKPLPVSTLTFELLLIILVFQYFARFTIQVHFLPLRLLPSILTKQSHSTLPTASLLFEQLRSITLQFWKPLSPKAGFKPSLTWIRTLHKTPIICLTMIEVFSEPPKSSST